MGCLTSGPADGPQNPDIFEMRYLSFLSKLYYRSNVFVLIKHKYNLAHAVPVEDVLPWEKMLWCVTGTDPKKIKKVFEGKCLRQNIISITVISTYQSCNHIKPLGRNYLFFLKFPHVNFGDPQHRFFRRPWHALSPYIQVHKQLAENQEVL